MRLGERLRLATTPPARPAARKVLLETHHQQISCAGSDRRAQALALLGATPLAGAALAGGDERLSGRPLFLDTETTGLGTGPGTVAFLVGIARWEGEAGELLVEQRLMTGFGAEAELLRWVRGELLESGDCLVSYNGRCFDWPLLQARAIMQRLGGAPPAARPEPGHGLVAEPRGTAQRGLPELPHLDLLPPARALWAGLVPDCRLLTLEASLLDFRRSGDIPGAEIPGAWLRFVRGGDRQEIDRILAHNREDLVSLAALCALVCGAFRGERIGGHAVQMRLGWALLRRRQPAAARRAFLRARELGGGEEQLYRGLATAQRRVGDLLGEEETLRNWISLSSRLEVEPYERLAILLEHRRRDFPAACCLTREALERLDLARAFHPEQGAAAAARLLHRLARLERRCGERVHSKLSPRELA